MTESNPDNATWTGRYQAALLDVFGPPQRVLARGEGCYVWDKDGQRYLDLLGGIAVNALGHAHPAYVAAVSQQAATLGQISNFFASEPQIQLAERLLKLTCAPAGSRVFFTNSGTEAIEAVIKMARRLAPGGLAEPPAAADALHRTRLLALENAFHGRSTGALALTHKAAYREPFGPLLGPVEFLPVASSPDPLADLAAAFAPEAVAARGPVAALFVEPIQGEAGVQPLPVGYLQKARELTTAAGALLVVDEIQTGIARTGDWFAYQREGVQPDVLTLAKGLGGGLPIGAVVAFGDRVAKLLGRGQHGTTFGGNPIATAAALAVLDTIEREDLIANASEQGEALRRALAACPSPLVTGVRGAGLLLAVTLAKPVAADVVQYGLDHGVIVNAVAPDAVRIAPALTIGPDEVAQAAAFFAALPADLGSESEQPKDH